MARRDEWELIAGQGMRKLLGIEMEAAAIGAVAYLRHKPFVVVKGVMDHGDKFKTDRFKRFAARASAEVMCKLLRLVVGTESDQVMIKRQSLEELDFGSDPEPMSREPFEPSAIGQSESPGGVANILETLPGAWDEEPTLEKYSPHDVVTAYDSTMPNALRLSAFNAVVGCFF